MGERVRRGGFRHSSVAGRVGSVDRRAQRRAQWNVLYADADRLRRLHAQAIAWPLRDDVDLVRVRIDVETDVDYGADRSAAARLLAARSFCKIDMEQALDRKDSIVCIVGGFMSRNFVGTKLCARVDRVPAAEMANHQRGDQLL